MNILFLCTGNSCRSQMAEGYARKLLAGQHAFYSAGTKKHGLNPRAMQVLKEDGVDTRDQFSKTIEELPSDLKIDVVFTICSDADENCPYFPGGKIIHHGFDDPPRITSEMRDEEEILSVYRRVRDEIKNFVCQIEQCLEPS